MEPRILQYKTGKALGLIITLELVLFALFGLGWYLVEFKLTGVRFDHPLLTFGAIACVVFSIGFLFSLYRKNKSIQNFGDPRLLAEFIAPISTSKSVLKFTLWRLALFFLFIGLSNPKIGSKSAEGKTEGIDIVFALDVSNSMLAEDVIPNRLTAAKRAIDKIIQELHGDRIALVVFAGQSYIQMPLSADHSALKLYLQGVNTNMVSTQGTAIGNALNLSLRCFDMEHPASKVIVLITDGENHEDDAVKAAQKAADQGILIHTVGFGSEKGAPIPDMVNGRKQGFKKDKSGQTVISKTNIQTLQELADIGSGTTSLIQGGSIQVEGIIEALEGLQSAELDSVVYTDYEDRFQWFLFPALLFILIELIITEKYQKWIEKWRFFGK